MRLMNDTCLISAHKAKVKASMIFMVLCWHDQKIWRFDIITDKGQNHRGNAK